MFSLTRFLFIALASVSAWVLIAACSSSSGGGSGAVVCGDAGVCPTNYVCQANTCIPAAGSGGGGSFVCIDISKTGLVAGDCTEGDQQNCACSGCAWAECGWNDCTCPGPCSPVCNFCNLDGLCDPYSEGCTCADCAKHPLCLGAGFGGTGGGSSGGSGGAQDCGAFVEVFSSQCRSCAEVNCCSQMADCNTTTPCWDLLSCIAEYQCPTDPIPNPCVTENCAGIDQAAFAALGTCIMSNCSICDWPGFASN